MRSLNCKTNKSQSLYGTESLCVSLAANIKGTGFLSGHNDGSVVRYYLNDGENELSGRILYHPVPPFALAWNHDGFCIGGCDQRIVFYDKTVGIWYL